MARKPGVCGNRLGWLHNYRVFAEAKHARSLAVSACTPPSTHTGASCQLQARVDLTPIGKAAIQRMADEKVMTFIGRWAMLHG